jgi:hypothetical protein
VAYCRYLGSVLPIKYYRYFYYLWRFVYIFKILYYFQSHYVYFSVFFQTCGGCFPLQMCGIMYSSIFVCVQIVSSTQVLRKKKTQSFNVMRFQQWTAFICKVFQKHVILLNKNLSKKEQIWAQQKLLVMVFK